MVSTCLPAPTLHLWIITVPVDATHTAALGSGGTRLRVPSGLAQGQEASLLLCARHSKSRWPKPAPIQGQGLRLLTGRSVKEFRDQF